MSEYTHYAAICKALGSPVRLELLEILREHHGSLSVEALLPHVQERYQRTYKQPTLSHHLQALDRAGLLHCRVKGTWHYYSVDEEALARFAQRTRHLAQPQRRHP